MTLLRRFSFRRATNAKLCPSTQKQLNSSIFAKNSARAAPSLAKSTAAAPLREVINLSLTNHQNNASTLLELSSRSIYASHVFLKCSWSASLDLISPSIIVLACSAICLFKVCSFSRSCSYRCSFSFSEACICFKSSIRNIFCWLCCSKALSS